MGVILAVNAGSSSLKAALIGDGTRRDFHYANVTGAEHAAVFRQLISECARAKIDLVGHRVTHGGETDEPAHLIDPAELTRLRALIKWAPLHQTLNLLGIEALSSAYPVAQIACFDTAFHRTLPALARRLPVPLAPGLRRYGFHGLAYASVAHKLVELIGAVARQRVVVAHLGSGASLCLLNDLQSVDTTMSLSPLGGIAMSSRSGDLDPAVVFELLVNHDAESARRQLYRESGLLAVSNGISNDMRVLLASAEPAACFAVDYFCRDVTAAIGALAAKSGGIDALVFSGGIGQHSAEIRARICAPLGFMGISLDQAANTDNAIRIEADRSVPVILIKVDEETEIARAAQAVLERSRSSGGAV